VFSVQYSVTETRHLKPETFPMYELSLFILDLAQNSLSAGASLIKVWLAESEKLNRLTVTVADNGCGMEPEVLEKALDPFMTTKTGREKEIGLGLPFFKQLVESCDGTFKIKSWPGTGTVVTGSYLHDHFDQPPIGKLEEIIFSLVAANPSVDFVFTRKTDEKSKYFDTRPVRKALGPDAELIWQTKEVLDWFRRELDVS